MPQELAREFGGIALSGALADTLARAADHARQQGHRQITLEHLLLALCEDPEAGIVLSACAIDLERLREDIFHSLSQLEEPATGSGEVTVAPELKRILDYATAAAQQGGRAQVTGAIVLAAMVGEGRSMAASFLQTQGLTFESAVRVLQEQSRTQRSPQLNGTAAPPSTEEILAGARQRVEASRGTTGQTRAAPERSTQPNRTSPDTLQAPTDRQSGGPSGNVAGDQAQADTAKVAGPPPLPPSSRPDAKPAEADSGNGSAQPNDRDHPTRPPLPPWMLARQGKVRVDTQTPKPEPDRPGHRPGAVVPAKKGPELLHPSAQTPAPAPPQPKTLAPRPLSSEPAIQPGQLVENIPRRMVVGVTETVEVRIGRDGAQGLMIDLQGRGTPARHSLFVTKAMSVRLRAPQSGFAIDPASPETQWIEATVGPLSGEFAVWRFAVTPNRRGERTLQLIVSARTLGTDGVMADTTLPERIVTVRVRTNYGRTALQWSGWIAALLIGGVLGKAGEGLFANALLLAKRAISG
jgi:hypothetical protein